MAEIPFLIPALLTSIPAALCLTWIYQRRRNNRSKSSELIHLHALRSSVLRKKAKKRQRLANAGDEQGLEHSRSLLTSANRERMRRKKKREREGRRTEDNINNSLIDEHTSDESTDDESSSDESSEYSDEYESEAEEDDDDEEDSTDDEDEAEHSVEIEMDAVIASMSKQLNQEEKEALDEDEQKQLQSVNGTLPSSLHPVDGDHGGVILSNSHRRHNRSVSHSSKSQKKSHKRQQSTQRQSSDGLLPPAQELNPAESAASPAEGRASNTILPEIRSKHRSIYGILYLNLLEASVSTVTPAAFFCVVSHGTQVYRTHTSKKSVLPIFNQKVRLVIREREVNWPVSLSLWMKRGKRRGGGVLCVGRCVMDPREMMQQKLDAPDSVRSPLPQPDSHSSSNPRKRRGSFIMDDMSDHWPVHNYWQPLSAEAQPVLPPAHTIHPSSTDASPRLHIHAHKDDSHLQDTDPLIISRSVSTPLTSSARVHLETLFIPLPSSTVGHRMWAEISSLYDVHDEGRVGEEHVQQLLHCIGGMKDDYRIAILSACHANSETAGSITVEELTNLLTRFEHDTEREIKQKKKQYKKMSHTNSDNALSNAANNIAAQTETSSLASSVSATPSSSSSSLSSVLVDVPLNPTSSVLPQTTELTPMYLSKCPVCLLDLTPATSLDPRDCLIHVRFCLENVQSLSDDALQEREEYAMGGFISEEYAVKNWASTMMNGEHYGSDKLLTYLSSRAHFILVQDRKTGQLRTEKVPFLVKLLFRFIYQSPLGRTAHSSVSLGLLARMTEMMGRKYDHMSSRAHISAFIHYYGIDMNEFEKPAETYQTFNEFFYRKLKPGVRPIAGLHDDSIIVSPADCRITVFQSVSEATRIWIKGKTFSLSSLLVDPVLVRSWPDCSLAIARLAPDDYHRFHLPVSCVIGESRVYSGGYASVNPLAIRSQKDVLTQNKRVLTVLTQTVVDDLLYIAVGATMVGSVILTSQPGEHKQKGDEHGYFAFGGSTVLLLFRPGSIKFDEDLLYNTGKSMETLIRMGESIGRVTGYTYTHARPVPLAAAPAATTAVAATAVLVSPAAAPLSLTGRPASPHEVAPTLSTINPLSKRKLTESESVLNAIGEQEEAGGIADVEEELDGVAVSAADLTKEDLKEVTDVLMQSDM